MVIWKLKRKKYKSQSQYIDIYENSKNESENDDKKKKNEEFIEIDITPNLDNKQDKDSNNNSEKSSINNSRKELDSEEEYDNSNDIWWERDQ